MAFFHRWFGHPSEGAFLRLVSGQLHRIDPTLAMHPDLDAYTLVLRRGRHRVAELNLALAREEFCAAPPLTRARVLARWCALPFAAPAEAASLEEAIPCLLPRVRDRLFYDLNALRQRLEGRAPLRTLQRPFAGPFVLTLIQDHPETMVDLLEEQLDAWDVDLETLLTHARRNLRALSDAAFVGLSPGLYRSPWKDNHDAARLLFPDLLRGLDLKGIPVAMAPHRDALLVAGSEDPSALARMARAALEELQKPRALCGTLLRLEGEAWTPWLPDSPLELHHAFAMLEAQDRLRACEEQRELLQALLRHQGAEAWVAPLRLDLDPGGGVGTTALLPRQGETWLPRVDLVELAEGHDGPVLRKVPWEALPRWTAAPLEAEVGLWPERFRVQGWLPVPRPLPPHRIAPGSFRP